MKKKPIHQLISENFKEIEAMRAAGLLSFIEGSDGLTYITISKSARLDGKINEVSRQLNFAAVDQNRNLLAISEPYVPFGFNLTEDNIKAINSTDPDDFIVYTRRARHIYEGFVYIIFRHKGKWRGVKFKETEASVEEFDNLTGFSINASNSRSTRVFFSTKSIKGDYISTDNGIENISPLEERFSNLMYGYLYKHSDVVGDGSQVSIIDFCKDNTDINSNSDVIYLENIKTGEIVRWDTSFTIARMFYQHEVNEKYIFERFFKEAEYQSGETARDFGKFIADFAKEHGMYCENVKMYLYKVVGQIQEEGSNYLWEAKKNVADYLEFDSKDKVARAVILSKEIELIKYFLREDWTKVKELVNSHIEHLINSGYETIEIGKGV